jgi:3-oxoacyl-[acyl-carrier-protein] synthase III
MILGSQLAALGKSSVLVVQADAAKKATSKSKEINKIFGNGSFACLISHDKSERGLLHYKSRQYKGLSEVVTIRLGHDADELIMKEKKDITNDPRKHLGLSMNNSLGLKLIKNAESFYLEFVKESIAPDVMILHQVNPLIIKHLQSVFSKYKMEFVDVAEITGNCGAASVGIALSKVKDTVQNKKVLLCSFGTGGIITAGLWQN